MCSKCNSLATFILGALIGAAAGILYAPAKGDTTRKKLKKWAKETYKEEAEEWADRAAELKGKVLDHTAELREKIAGRAADVKERAGEIKDKISAKADELKHQALEKTEDLRSAAADGLEKAAKKLR